MILVGNLWQWGQVQNPCNMTFLQFLCQLDTFRSETKRGSPRFNGWRSSWISWAGRCCSIDWIVSQQFWRHSQCTWRWQPLSWEQLRVEHLRPTITTLVEVISLPQWHTTWKFLSCTGGWLWTVVCHVEWRMVINMWSTWKLLLWRRVTRPIPQMILIGVFRWSTVSAQGNSWTILWWTCIVIMALLQSKLATQWSHIRCLRWRYLHQHALYKLLVVNYWRCTVWCGANQSLVEYSVVSSDPRRNEGFLISHCGVTSCSAALHHWSVKPTRLRERHLQ